MAQPTIEWKSLLWLPIIVGIGIGDGTLVKTPPEGSPASIYDFRMKTIDGDSISLRAYEGTVLLVVNVASECGYTPQYASLEALDRKYAPRGLKVLGFPANNFGGQEPGTDAEIKEFCTMNFGVSFDLFSKISVKGEDKHPLYIFLTSEETNPGFAGEIQWNFQKFLVNRQGTVVGRFASAVDPLSPELVSVIERALAEE
ncbi:MAG: glutathione peroxidase [Bacteroidetes bacterium]|nr:glutathione peroxidase [Bacteroidota bacterium]